MADATEEQLARALDDELTVTDIASKFAPRDGLTPHVLQQRRVTSPNEHFSEAIMTLNKTLEEYRSLRDRLLGGGKGANEMPKSPIDNNSEPVVVLLHKQADEIARISAALSAITAEIRGKF